MKWKIIFGLLCHPIIYPPHKYGMCNKIKNYTPVAKKAELARKFHQFLPSRRQIKMFRFSLNFDLSL